MHCDLKRPLFFILCILRDSQLLYPENLLYMDDYGRCQDPTFFEVVDDVYVISAKGSGQMFSTKRCSLRFRTKANQHLCVEFKHFQIDDCSVHFNLFQEKWPVNLHMEPDDVYLYRGYSCGDAPETVCSTATNLTLQLYKRIIHVQEYSFSVELSSKSDHDERWVIVGVISGLLITVILVIIVCRCRKKNRQICEVFRRRRDEDHLHDTSLISYRQHTVLETREQLIIGTIRVSEM